MPKNRLSNVLCNSKNALPSEFVVAMVTSACNHCSHVAMVTGVVLVLTSLLPRACVTATNSVAMAIHPLVWFPDCKSLPKIT